MCHSLTDVRVLETPQVALSRIVLPTAPKRQETGCVGLILSQIIKNELSSYDDCVPSLAAQDGGRADALYSGTSPH
jgi:hypothetical protein